MSEQYSYSKSVKSRQSDELINTYLLRPIAGLVVRLLYRTPITPNQVTLLSILSGLAASLFYFFGSTTDILVGGLLVTAKDLLDTADGQLARAKNLYSRSGRFLDSIGDFVVNAAVFAGIGISLFRAHDDALYLLLAALGFFGITLRVSYHVFYQVSFLHLQDLYSKNRLTEEITEADRRGDRVALRLQQIFLALYGWQDRLMVRLDQWCRRGIESREALERWYSDRRALAISSFLGIGTELFVLMVCSVANKLEPYLVINIGVLNGLWIISVLYRRWVVAGRIEKKR